MSCPKTHWRQQEAAQTALQRIARDVTDIRAYTPTHVIRCRCGGGFVLTSNQGKDHRKGKIRRAGSSRRHRR